MTAPLPPVDRYVYILGDLPFLILWLGVYCGRKDLRRPLWIMSLFTTAGSLTGPFFREDYFHPKRIWDLGGLGLEDVIFCFSVGGLLFAANKVLAGWHLHQGDRPRSALYLLPLPFFYTAAFLLLIQLAGLDSIRASFVVLTAQVLLIGATRPDLIMPSLLSGATGGAVLFFFYAFLYFPLFPWIRESWWEPSAIKVTVLGVPFEEIAWAVLTGALLGTLYEWLTGTILIRPHVRGRPDNLTPS